MTETLVTHIHRIDVSVVGNQQLNHVVVPRVRRMKQCGSAFPISRFDVCTVLHQNAIIILVLINLFNVTDTVIGCTILYFATKLMPIINTSGLSIHK